MNIVQYNQGFVFMLLPRSDQCIAVILKSTYPDASVGVCCSHKVVAVGFNTLCYDATSVGVLNASREVLVCATHHYR